MTAMLSLKRIGSTAGLGMAPALLTSRTCTEETRSTSLDGFAAGGINQPTEGPTPRTKSSSANYYWRIKPSSCADGYEVVMENPKEKVTDRNGQPSFLLLHGLESCFNTVF